MEAMVKVGGGTVWAEDTGGPGAPVVLLHPGVGDSRIWEAVMPRLAGRYRVIRYDARGHGESPPATAPYTLRPTWPPSLTSCRCRQRRSSAAARAAPAPSTSR